MRAVVYAGPGKVRVDDVPEPELAEPTDALVEVRLSAICASDLHLLHGKTPGAREGAVIGHEFVGIVTEFGDDVAKHHEGTRVLGSFLIACGTCSACAARRYNFCANRRALGLGTLSGDLDGAQAEMVRVPNADLNLKPLGGGFSGLSDEEALFGGDIMTTGFYAAELAEVGPEDVVVVVGAGPVGLFSALAAARRSPRQLLVLDSDPARVAFASDLGLEAIDVSTTEAASAVAGKTEGALADVVVEAVGSTEALRSSLKCVREGGRVAVVGVYGQERYDLHMGMAWIRGLELRFAGMANIHAHWEEALLAVAKGELDPTVVITHRLDLNDAETGYELFEDRRALKVVLSP